MEKTKHKSCPIDKGYESLTRCGEKNYRGAETFEKERLEKVKRNLHSWLKYAYKGRVSIDKLHQKGLELEKRINEFYPEFWDNGIYPNLKEALEFIATLHDKETREYLSRNKEQIYHYMVNLSSE